MFVEQELLRDLVAAQVFSQDEIDEARGEAERLKKSIFAVLSAKDKSKESALVRFVAEKRGLLFVSKISERMVDPLVLVKIAFKFLRQHAIIPVIFEGRVLLLAASFDGLQALDDVASQLSVACDYGFAPRDVIVEAINRYYPFDVGQEAIDELRQDDEDDFDIDEIKEQDILDMANDAPIVKLVNHIIFQSIKEGASDIHIEPFEKELRVRCRIDGIMHHKISPPKRYLGAIVSRIKIMANLNIAEKRIPQDGRIQIKVAEKSIDLRVSVLPCNYGERVVMRILDKSKGVVELETIAFSPRDLKVILKMIERPNGIVLVSGPTGSGKTTTLYSVLARLNNEDSNIITVEDPVEYSISGISQVQVNVKAGLTFASALRSILRQDPDIALIGEIRDGETAQIATQAALTGHLVLSTIHTNSAPATVTRLIDMGIEPFLIASSVICVIAQRLVRALCKECKEAYAPNAELLEKLGLANGQEKDLKFYKPVGCDECFGTGYRGRLPLFEVMEVTDKISDLIVKKADSSEIRKLAVESGMTTLSVDGINKAKQGLTSMEEVFTVSYVESN